MPRARVTISVLILHQVTRDKTAHTRGEGIAGGKEEGYNEKMKEKYKNEKKMKMSEDE
jgi:hypothetical protein